MVESPQRWNVILLKEPEKVLRRIPRELVERMARVIRGLAEDPWPPGNRKLTGYEGLYRLRVGEWRIIYSVHRNQLVVLVIEISPRGGAYRNL